MPPTPESKVTVGQKIQIKAETWNTLVDVARAFKRDQPVVENPFGLTADAKAGLHCLIQNDTSGDLQVYSVLRMTDPIEDIDADPYNAFGAKAIRGTVPSASTDSVAILQRSIDKGTFGLALFQGITPCKLFLNSSSHQYARPIAGNEVYMETALDSGVAKIIWKSSTVDGGGLVWALIQLIGPTPAGSGAVVADPWVWARIDSGTNATGYVGTKATLTGPNTWTYTTGTTFSPIWRAPSQLAARDFPAGQVVAVRPSITNPGTYEAQAPGGIFDHTMDIVTNVQCISGELVVTKATYTFKARDLQVTS